MPNGFNHLTAPSTIIQSIFLYDILRLHNFLILIISFFYPFEIIKNYKEWVASCYDFNVIFLNEPTPASFSFIFDLCWNKALWLAVPINVTSFKQSECIISLKHSFATLKNIYDISSCVYDFWCFNNCSQKRWCEEWMYGKSGWFLTTSKNIKHIPWFIQNQWPKYFSNAN